MSARLRSALIRLLWRSIADDAECTCGPDQCPECEAMTALGLGRWRGARHAREQLATHHGVS